MHSLSNIICLCPPYIRGQGNRTNVQHPMGCIWYCQGQFSASTRCARSMSTWFRCPLLEYWHQRVSLTIDGDWIWLENEEIATTHALVWSHKKLKRPCVCTKAIVMLGVIKQKYNLIKMHTYTFHNFTRMCMQAWSYVWTHCPIQSRHWLTGP